MIDNFSRIERLPPYPFNITFELKNKYIKSGIDIIDFSMGNPDQSTPDKIVEYLIKSVKNPSSHRYTESQGIFCLRESMSNWISNRINVKLDPQKEIIITLGSKEGISHLAMAMINPGETVFVPDPCYPIHKYAFILSGAKVISLNGLSPENLIEDLKDKLENHTIKTLILNFPTNPTTACVDLGFFEEVVSLAKKYKFWIIHDYAYADIVFNNTKQPSILEVNGAIDVAVETYSMSKSFNMPGWRIGFVCGNRKLIEALKTIKSYYDYGTYEPIQRAAAYALDNSDAFIPSILNKYYERMKYLVDGLNNIGWKVDKPDATMFVWAKIPEKYEELGSLEFYKLLLKEANVSVTPGCFFGELGDKHVRFSLIENMSRMDIALEKINKFLQK